MIDSSIHFKEFLKVQIIILWNRKKNTIELCLFVQNQSFLFVNPYYLQKMNIKNKEDIVIFDDEDQIIEDTIPKQEKESNIFVFDDEQINQEEEENQQEKIIESNDENCFMSKKDFKDKCTKLEDRIIFSNLKNFKHDILKSQPTFFQDAKVKKRESQKQRKSINLQGRMSLLSNIPKDIKVDFVTDTSKKSIKIPQPSIRTQTQMESMMSDDIEFKGINFKKNISDYDIQGACLTTDKKQLKIEVLKDKNTLKVSNFREFLYTQLQPNYQISVLVKRTQNGIINSTYKFYFKQNKKFIMSCQKQGFSTYVFSSSEVHISEEHISYLGKMQSNFMGSQFVIFDSGQDCSKTKMMENYKKQLGYIAYMQDKDQPRRFQTYLTTCDNKLTDFTVIDKKTENVILDKWSKDNQGNIVKLNSKEPSYDPQDCSFKLDFKGFQGVPSIKNFIVDNQDYPNALLFSRQDKQTYFLNIKAPFSIIQGIAVGMSSIHKKFL